MASGLAVGTDDRYEWVALSNTTLAVFMSQLDGSIVLIALPAIFRGIHLDPLAPGNVFYLLWMITGYRLVRAVLVVTVGRFGDMFGRVRIYNAGFAVFTVASVLLSFDPFDGGHGALWLIGWRVLQAVGGSMLTANSAAILTDAFPRDQRGFALGINQVAGLSGQFIGLVAGGVLATLDWRAVFWVNVPVGLGLRPARWWRRAARGVRRDREQSRRAADRAPPVPHPGVHGRQRCGLRRFHRPRRAAVHAHHLAAGDLAAAARIQLQRHASVGRHLPAAHDCRLPDLGSRSRISL